jgi:two-component system OmpR family sensor kinase
VGRLYWKFFAFILLAQLLGILGVGGSIWLHDISRENTSELNHSPPAGFMITSVEATLAHGGPGAMRSLLAAMQRDRFAAFAVDENGGELLGRPVSAELLKQARALSAAGDTAARRVGDAGGRQYLLFVPQAVHEGHHLGAGPGHQARGPGPRGDLPFRTMIAAMLASLVSAALLARQISRPVRQLRQAFDEAANGNLNPELAKRMGGRHDEMGQLGQDFDRMAARLRVLMDGERKLLHDVSHELRSPLARMQAAIGLLRQQPARSVLMLDRIERESVRMDQLVGEILTLSRLDSAIGQPSDAQQPVDMDWLLANVAEDAAFEADLHDCSVHYAGTGSSVVQGNADLLRRAVENLVRNALRHTAQGTRIDISATIDEQRMLRITVSDRGPGVAVEELGKIFEPFYRGAANGEADGYGLGLAIAMRVAESHGGAISAHNGIDGGLRVDLVLPLKRA